MYGRDHRTSYKPAITDSEATKACLAGQLGKGPRDAAPCITSISYKCPRDVSADVADEKAILLRYGHQYGHQSSIAECGNYQGRIFGRIEL